ncbi:MAG: hypothetical protein JWQ35_631 [Bacteriovoracaceae bacterium]|nr:hypothetical protein [Bacteriovoracaceae bacterium]
MGSIYRVVFLILLASRFDFALYAEKDFSAAENAPPDFEKVNQLSDLIKNYTDTLQKSADRDLKTEARERNIWDSIQRARAPLELYERAFLRSSDREVCLTRQLNILQNLIAAGNVEEAKELAAAIQRLKDAPEAKDTSLEKSITDIQKIKSDFSSAIERSRSDLVLTSILNSILAQLQNEMNQKKDLLKNQKEVTEKLFLTLRDLKLAQGNMTVWVAESKDRFVRALSTGGHYYSDKIAAEEKLAGATSELSYVKESLEKKDATIAELTKTRTDLNTQIAQMAKQIEDGKKEAKKVQEKIEAESKKAVEDLNATNSTLQAQIAASKEPSKIRKIWNKISNYF